MKKSFLFTTLSAWLFLTSCSDKSQQTETLQQPTTSSTESVVYATRTISPESLVKMYEVLGREASGRVAVKK